MLFRGRRRIDFVLDRNRSIRATRKTWPKLDNRWGSSDLFRTDHCRVPCWDRWRRRRRWAAPTAGRRERRYRLVLRLLYRIAFDFLKMVEKSLNTSLYIFFTPLSQNSLTILFFLIKLKTRMNMVKFVTWNVLSSAETVRQTADICVTLGSRLIRCGLRKDIFQSIFTKFRFENWNWQNEFFL